MDDFVKSIFGACDKDQDGYLDRSDLEEVRKQVGFEGNIDEILEQFGATDTGKISFQKFCEKSTVLFPDLNHSSSDSSPEYYSTDSETQHQHPIKQQMAEKSRKKDERKDTISKSQFYVKDDLDMELAASNEKIKELSAKWDLSSTSYRKSGGGIQDFLDEATVQHLEKMNILPAESSSNSNNAGGFASSSIPKNGGSRNEDSLQYSSDQMDMNPSSGPDYLEITQRLHLAALTSYKNEIYNLNSRLQQMRQERDGLRKEQTMWQYEKQKMQQDFEDKLQSQTMRITELQSVIAELHRKLNKSTGNTIAEEDEEYDGEQDGEEQEDDARSDSTSDLEVQGSHNGSECSCEDCVHRQDEEGPNLVNFLATTHDTIGNDLNKQAESLAKQVESAAEEVDGEVNSELQQQLHQVLGRLERRKTNTVGETTDQAEPSESELIQSLMNEGRNAAPQEQHVPNYQHLIDDLNAQLDALKKDKRSLEKQLHDVSVQGYVYQKDNTTHVEEAFSKLRQENSYLRSKLRKAEQEVEDLKAMNITVREEKERLKKKNRSLQESIEDRIRAPSPMHSTGSAGSAHGHRRSQSQHLDRSQSPLQRSSSAVSDPRNQNVPATGHQRSASFDNQSPVMVHRSPSLPQRANSDTRKSSLASHQSPSHSTHSLPSHPASAFVTVNSKGYTVSPDNSLRRGQHVLMESSDLGSSIGEESHQGDLSKALVRNLHGHIPETLLKTLLTYNNYDQVLRTLVNHFTSEVDEKIREGSINVERLQSRIAHLQSQNDLWQFSLEESKRNAERLSLLCGKHESNSTAWSLALQNTEHLIETYEVMLQLQESEADIYAANCHAAGIAGNFDTMKSLTSTKSSQSNISIASSSSHQMMAEDEEMFKSYQSKRKDAESQAKSLLVKLDKKYENMMADDDGNKTDEMSYQSRTSTGSSQNSTYADTISKNEEHRLRSYIKQLKKERGVCKSTIVELESVYKYTDNPVEESETTERVTELNMDIETAVLLQEMQALKEERAELKHRIYLFEKEKKALELKMNSREAQEQAYIVHIEHLKSEVKEQIKKRKILMKERTQASIRMTGGSNADDDVSIHSGSTGTSIGQHTSSDHQYSADEVPLDLVEASRRERKLKHRIQELVETLDKLSRNSEQRHKQTAEYISDLKRANGALVTAYEKAKKRHASRLKKFEQQLVAMADKYQVQMRALKEQIKILKDTPQVQQIPQTETSL